jgi:putative transposase
LKAALVQQHPDCTFPEFRGIPDLFVHRSILSRIGASDKPGAIHTHGRTATLWEGRYKSTLVDADTYLLTVYRYIELNPVRAGMVDHASEYPWSSYRSNALGKAIQLILPHPQYQQLGKSAQERQRAYRSLFKGRMPERNLAAIREATNKAWTLGDNRFRQQIEARTGKRAVPLGRGGDRKSEKYQMANDQ